MEKLTKRTRYEQFENPIEEKPKTASDRLRVKVIDNLRKLVGNTVCIRKDIILETIDNTMDGTVANIQKVSDMHDKIDIEYGAQTVTVNFHWEPRNTENENKYYLSKIN